MASGFGKSQPQPKPSKRSKARAKAAKQLDQRRASGDPEFEVYIRVKDKKPWYPVGVIAVKRSGQVNQAIFRSLEDLQQGAFRLYPTLKKNKNQLEYGYRLKEFKDEPIQLAVEPKLGGFSALSGIVNQFKNRILGLFKKG